jgi:hypothetical protein
MPTAGIHLAVSRPRLGQMNDARRNRKYIQAFRWKPIPVLTFYIHISTYNYPLENFNQLYKILTTFLKQM